MVSQGYTRSEYDHCLDFKILNDIFIILVLYVDDMLIVSKSTDEINSLKAQMARTFDMIDIGATKKYWVLRYIETEEIISLVFHKRSMLRKYL